MVHGLEQWAGARMEKAPAEMALFPGGDG